MAHIYSQTAISKSVPEPMQWLPAQGPKITDMILDLVTCTQRFLQILSFDDLPCRWWDVKSLHNFTMWHIILKLFHNLMMDFFTDLCPSLLLRNSGEKQFLHPILLQTCCQLQIIFQNAGYIFVHVKSPVVFKWKKKILMHTSEQWFLRLIALNWFVFCSPEILYFERVCKVFESDVLPSNECRRKCFESSEKTRKNDWEAFIKWIKTSFKSLDLSS